MRRLINTSLSAGSSGHPLIELWTLSLCLVFPHIHSTAAGTDLVRHQFREVDTLFANPGQGWMSQQRSPRSEPRFPGSVVYIRFNWGDAEPEEGRFDWKLIDDVIAAWRPHGAAVALRVMTCNAHSSAYYTSPKRLFDAGCKGHEFLVGGDDPTSGGQRIPRIEPDYSDPIYLEKRGAFLDAAGQTAFTADAVADPRDWLPGEYRLTETLSVPPTLKLGDYTLGLALVDPTGTGRAFRLAMDAPEKQERYEISTLRVR